MKRLRILVIVMAGLLATIPAAVARDDDHRDKENKFATRLSGYNEVHFSGGGGATLPVPGAALRGAVSTKARGKFEATIDKHMNVIEYKLSYEGLQGEVTQGHIHFGQRHTVGGIVVWLCQTAGTQAPEAVRVLTPTCPPEGEVKGTITPEQVLAQTLQGFEAGEFDELLRAIRAGATYANVHSTLHPPGEIRGQIKKDDKNGKDNRDHRHHR
jgi:CHRD domain